MNILFFTCDKLSATKGGTERTTITVATALKDYYGAHCFSIYERPANTLAESCIEKEFFWPRIHGEHNIVRFLHEILKNNRIDCVVVQGAFIHVDRFSRAAKGLNCKIFFAHHFRPEWELEFLRFQFLFTQRPQRIVDFIRLCRDILYFPFRHKKSVENLRHAYLQTYNVSHNVVLLSKRFIPLYKKFGRLSEDKKFVIIPNGLSFNEFIPVWKISDKKPIVLIVSRLDERQKCVSKALHIWKQVKQNKIANDWSLRIIGEGSDAERYHNIVRNEHIPDVEFLGRCNPLPHFHEASIFMMTSISEAWGLTLTEAQQMGVVPVAFDTYESLHDIITDGENGRIIPGNDFQGYANAILELMANGPLRKGMALNGLESCKRFSQDRIAQMWWQLLQYQSNE